MGYKTYTCPVGKDCGGCELLAVPYPKQLERKHAYIKELFESYDAEVEPVLGMDEPVRYRAKIQTPFVRGRKGLPRFGMYARHSHDLVECDDCLVEHEYGRPILQTIAELCQYFHIEAYDENTGRGMLRHVIVRVGENTDQVMVTLVINRKEFPHKKAFVAELRDEHPEISTVVFNVNTRKTNAVLGNKTMTAYGQGWIEDEVCGCTFRIPATAFYQTNPRQTEVLYQTAIDLAQVSREDVVFDAYCGIGTIGLIAAKQTGCSVVGVESVPEAVEIAYENAQVNRIKYADFAAGDAGEFLANSEGSPDVVFMDPPRAGASEQFMVSLLEIEPERIVYISCNPETQVRDLEVLRGAYNVERIIPVDMFPHTKHVECVVLLSRAWE